MKPEAIINCLMSEMLTIFKAVDVPIWKYPVYSTIVVAQYSTFSQQGYLFDKSMMLQITIDLLGFTFSNSQFLFQKKDTKFTNVVFVYDNGILDDEGQKWSKADVSITVVGSDKQLPRITRRGSDTPIVLKEDYNDFSAHLVTLDAE